MIASEELWIIGTGLLTELTGKLEALKRDHDKDPQQNYFFLQEKFDIVTRLKNPRDVNQVTSEYNFVRSILNDLIYHLNTRTKLPSRILIIIGHDALQDINFVKVGFKTVFTWLLDEIQFAILHKINTAPSKMSCIVSPEVIFVKLIPKLEGTASSDQKMVRRKFNKILETVLHQYNTIKFSFINIGEITSETRDYFHKNGSLNDAGNLTYWISLSGIINTQIARANEAIRPVEATTQTDEYLLTDYINIQAEKIVNDRETQRHRRQEFRGHNDGQSRYRNNAYERDHVQHKRSNTYGGNDKYHYYRR